jgi:hypothetical protein
VFVLSTGFGTASPLHRTRYVFAFVDVLFVGLFHNLLLFFSAGSPFPADNYNNAGT